MGKSKACTRKHLSLFCRIREKYYLTEFRAKGTPEGKTVSEVLLQERDTKEVFSDKYRMFFINLEAFNKTENQCESKLEEWIYSIKNMGTLTTTPEMALKNEIFTRLYTKAELAVLPPKERAQYEYELKIYRDILWDQEC